MMAVFQRLDRSLDDMAGCLEVGLADRQADDALALGLQRLGAGQDFERGFGAKAAHAARQVKHEISLGEDRARLEHRRDQRRGLDEHRPVRRQVDDGTTDRLSLESRLPRRRYSRV